MLSEKQKYIYLSIAAIPIILLIWGITILLSSPYIGIDFEKKNDKWYISYIDKESPVGLYPELLGKEVVSIAGWEVKQDDIQMEMDFIQTRNSFDHFWSANNFFYNNLHVGVPIILKVNGAKVSEYTITPNFGIPPRHLFLDMWIYVLAVLIYLFIGITIIFKKPNDLVAKVFFWMSIAVAIFYTCNVTYAYREITLPQPIFYTLWLAYNFLNMYAIAFAAYFMMIFPNILKIARNKIFVPIYFTAPALCFILAELQPDYPIFKITLLTYILMGLIAFLYNYFSIQSVADRAAMRWIFITLVSFVLIITLFDMLLPMLTGHQYINRHIIILLSLTFPLSLAFAITKYRLMDIDSLFDNTLIYTTTLALLALMDFVIISVLVDLSILEINSVLTMVLGIWFIIIGYLPVRNTVQRYIKKALKRGAYDMNEVSLLLSRELISVQDVKEAFYRVAKILQKTLYPIGSSAHLLGEKGSVMVYGDHTDMPPIPLTKIEKTAEPTLLYQMTKPENLSDDYSGGIFVPVVDCQKQQVGYFLLQNKESGRLYDRDDIRFLNLTVSQLAMAMEAIYAREKAIIEKERLSKEIHDGVGTTLAQALIMTRNSAKYKVDDLQKLLTNGLDDMRELLWAVDKRESSLKRTITHILDKLKVMEDYLHVESEIKLLDEEIPLPPGVRINLTRIAQEAMSNILHHSGANKAYLSFVQKGNTLEMTIRDEGAGFDISQEIAAGHYGLGNMKRRSEEIGAHYSIVSEKGKGTTVSMKIDIIQ